MIFRIFRKNKVNIAVCHVGGIKLSMLLAALLVSSCTQNSALDACALQSPPKDAAVYKTHAMDFLVYPEKIDGNYSGCQKVWLPNNHLLISTHFSNGVITRGEWFEPDQKPVTCEFNTSKTLTKGDEKDCLPYEKWLIDSSQKPN